MTEILTKCHACCILFSSITHTVWAAKTRMSNQMYISDKQSNKKMNYMNESLKAERNVKSHENIDGID